MRIYYHSVPEATSPNRHKIVAAVWESDYPAFDDREQSSGGPLPDGRLVLRIDETRTNMPPLIALARSLTMPRRPGRPTPPRYRVRPPDAIELPDDTYWVPETNLDRRGLLGHLANPDHLGYNVHTTPDDPVDSILVAVPAAGSPRHLSHHP